MPKIIYFLSLHDLKFLQWNNSYLTKRKEYLKHWKWTENPTMPEARKQLYDTQFLKCCGPRSKQLIIENYTG